LSFSQLTELYARRAREFSDAVALLGHYRDIGPEIVPLMQEIRRRRGLCFEAAEALERYVQEGKPMSDTQSAP